VPSGLLMAQYVLNECAAYLRGASVAGVSLGQIQAIDAPMTVTVDGTPITQTIDLAAATSFSNAASLIGFQLGIHGRSLGNFTASLDNAGNMTVTAFTTSNAQGRQRAEVVANLNGTTMTVTSVTGGYLTVGQIVSGTGITAGTTVASWNGGGVSGGVGSYTLSASATTGTGIAVTAYDAVPVLAAGQVVTGTGVTSGSYITGQTSGTPGGAGVYTLSQTTTTESAETIDLFAPACYYNPNAKAFQINSATLGAGGNVSFASGTPATTLNLTQGAGAVQSLGSAADNPVAFMTNVLTISQDWVSFMTSWEPTDADKSTTTTSFAYWNSSQDNQYRYVMWETNALDTESNGPSAAAAAVNADNYGGIVMIYTNPLITSLAGEKAAFMMGWAASLDFTRLNGRQTAAYRSYVGGVPDVTNGTVATTLAGQPQGGTFGYGINFYGQYTTRSQGFPLYQRGLISGEFTWDDSYVNQIWLNNSLQQDILIGLSQTPAVPYNTAGYALMESWCLDAILAAVNFGAINAGLQLSQAQIQEVNTAAGLQIDGALTQRGWYLQVLPAPAQTRATRSSPPATLWYCDGGSVQSITLASITIQ
jgi:hypothetical protein